MDASKGGIKVLRIVARMNVGGPAVQISGLMRTLSKADFDQELVTGYCDLDEADYLIEVATDIKATRILGLGRSVSALNDLRAMFAVIRIIREFKPDIVHTHTAKAGVIGRVASVLSLHRSFRVHTFHGHLLSGYFGKFKTGLVVLIERILAYKTHALFAVGTKVMDELLAKKIGAPEKFTVMPPGVENMLIPSRGDAAALLSLDPTKRYCSFIGRVTQIKRPDRFLDVVEKLRAGGSDLHFVVAGSGDLYEVTRKAASDRNLPIIFLGWQRDIGNALAISDFTVLTSDNEGMPLSIIQAGMAGVPAVSTDVGAVSEIIDEGVTGFVTCFEVKDLVAKISVLENDPLLAQKMGHAAQERYVKEFSVMRLAEDHSKIYNSFFQKN